MERRLLSLLIGAAMAVAMGSVAAQDTSGSMEKAVAKPAGKPGITAEQRSLLNEKLAIVDKLMRAAGANQVGASVSAERQRWMLESMYKMSVTQLRTMRLQGSPDLLANEIAKSAKVTAKLEEPALGQTTTELTFLPIQPCRYIDTRNVGGKITGARNYETFNTGLTYGGAAACDPKTLASVSDHNQIAAYALNVTIVDTSAAASPGWMTIRPYGSTNLTALVNWTVSSAGFQLGNSAVVTADQGPLAGEIEIYTSGSVHAIVDLAGAFTAPDATALDCTEVQANGSGTISNNTEAFGPARPACATGYTAVATSCAYTGSVPSGVTLTQVGPARPMSASWTACRWRNETGGSLPGSNFHTIATCCRIPGL
jgi:hypothetical protein